MTSSGDLLGRPSVPLGVTLELIGAHVGSHLDSLGYLRAPRTPLWLTFGAILAYPLLSWIDLCVTRLLCCTLWVTCIHFLCIMSLLFLHVVCLIYSLCVFCGHHVWLIWELCSLCASRPVVPRTPVSDRSHATPLELK